MDPRSDSYGTPKTGGGTITNANPWRGVVADSQPARHACRQGGFARSDVGWRKRLASRCSRGVRPKKCPTAAIWAGRLHPTPNKSPTVLEQRLLRSIDLEDRKSGLLQDPKTGLPAYCQNDSEGEYVATMYPRWLSTTAPLSSFTLMTAPSGSLPTRGTLACPSIRQCRTELGYSGSGP
jgi:hypothetical protein